MSRQEVIARLQSQFDNGSFLNELAGRIAIPTESQVPERFPFLRSYLKDAIEPVLLRMGYNVTLHDNPIAGSGPLLVGRRIENPDLPTVLTYGHGDVVRGHAGSWQDGRDPWKLEQVGERIYGRGVVDNKGQHSINLSALEAVIEVRGRLGFNSVFILETSEEIGSTGLHEFCRLHRQELKADLLIASDGPRLARNVPTLFMGTRGALNFDLIVDLRESGHHSGNWGGLIANPGVILANALSSIIDQHGRIKLRDLVPEKIPDSVRAALSGLVIEPGEEAPAIDPDYGEPGLTPVERAFAWNTFEVLAFTTGDPAHPVNAVPPKAVANCQIRFTVDRNRNDFLPALRRHLKEHKFDQVDVREAVGDPAWNATRLDPNHPKAKFAADSIEKTLGRRPAMLPNLGGSLPNDCFADVLGMPTIYVPHSYPGCSQHAPNEHGLSPLFREGLAMMGGLFWDLGDQDFNA